MLWHSLTPNITRTINSLLAIAGYKAVKLTDTLTLENQKKICAPRAEIAKLSHPSIFINTLPKSGSVYIYSALSSGLGLGFVQIGTNDFPESIIDIARIKEFASGNKVSQLHLPATLTNLMYLCLNIDKMVLHIRDPRNTMLSWIHFMDYTNNIVDLRFHAQHMPYSGSNWTDASMGQKIDRCIEYFYSDSLKWLQSWFDALEIDFAGKFIPTNDRGYYGDIHRNVHIIDASRIGECNRRYAGSTRQMEVLLTTHEDLVRSGEELFINRILSFYEIPSLLYKQPNIKKDMSSHFRAGRTDSWRTELTPAQQERVTSLIPKTWCSYFGWD